MEQQKTRKRIDWQQFLITVLGTAIGVALTFIVSGMIDQRKKEQAQRLTAIMIIHDIDNTIDILKSWKEQEEKIQVLQVYAVDHKDQKEPIPSDTLSSVLNSLVRRNTEYHFDTSKEKIFNSDVDTWQNLGNMKFIDNVQDFFYERQQLLELANTEEWFREPIPADEYMQVVIDADYRTQEDYDANRWAFLRKKLEENRVNYYISVSYARVSTLSNYIDRFTQLNEENKFIMGITDREMEDYVNSINKKGIALTKSDLPGHWQFTTKEQKMDYDFHSDNSYTLSIEYSSYYTKAEHWSGVYKIKVTYNGAWAFQRDSLVLTADFNTTDVQLDVSGIEVEPGMQDSLTVWMNRSREKNLEYFRGQAGKDDNYTVKAWLDSSKDKMEWTASDGEVRYLKRK